MSSDSPDFEGLTDAEREILTKPAAKVADEADDAATVAKVVAEPKAPAKQDPPAPSKNTDAPTFVPKIVSKPSDRDFDAELQTLEDKYADPDGGMTLEQYKKAERALIREQTTADVLQQVEQRTQESAAAFAAQNFNAAVKSFFDQPTSQDFKTDEQGNAPQVFRAAFQKACDFVDDGQMSNADVVSKAYATLKIMRADLFKEPVEQTDEEKADAAAQATKDAAATAKAAKDKQDAINKRKPDLKAIPVTIGSVPNAGEDQDQDSALDKLAAMDVAELEDQLAHMKPEDVEALLKKTPGSSTRGKAEK